MSTISRPDAATGMLGPSVAPDAEGRIDRAAAIRLAQEFESLLLTQMIRDMQSSMLRDDEDGAGLGRDALMDTVRVELSRSLSLSGGVGIARYLTQALERSDSVRDAPAAAEGAPASRPTVPVDRPSIMPPPGVERGDDSGLARPIDGVVTSAFGWRADPFHGERRLHRGIDIRAAYGREVPAAAAGEIVFAGERGAYGNLVIVAHENGVESRYAHLASIDVAVGQRVQAGEAVGRVGRSGRATAPHLHFEVLKNGQRVDPALVTLRETPLKKALGPVDLAIERLPNQADVSGVDHED